MYWHMRICSRAMSKDPWTSVRSHGNGARGATTVRLIYGYKGLRYAPTPGWRESTATPRWSPR